MKDDEHPETLDLPVEFRSDPDYRMAKERAIAFMRHAIEQSGKDQHVNALFAVTQASLILQELQSIIRRMG